MGMYCKNCGDEDSVEAKGELFVCSKCGTEYTKVEMQNIFSEYIFDMIGEIENSVNAIMETVAWEYMAGWMLLQGGIF